MDYQTIFAGEFPSINGSVWRVEITRQQDTAPDEVGELMFAGDEPLVFDRDETEFEDVLCGVSATLKLISPGDRTYIGLYSIRPDAIRIKVYSSGVLFWCGSLDPEFYEEPFECYSGYDVSLTFSDFGILDRVNFDLPARSSYTLREILTEAFARRGMSIMIVSSAGSLGVWDAPAQLKDADALDTKKIALDALRVNAANFYDEEAKPMTWREAIEGILQPLSFRVEQHNGVAWIYELSALTAYGRLPIIWKGDSQTLSAAKVYNSYSIKFSPYDQIQKRSDDFRFEFHDDHKEYDYEYIDDDPKKSVLAYFGYETPYSPEQVSLSPNGLHRWELQYKGYDWRSDVAETDALFFGTAVLNSEREPVRKIAGTRCRLADLTFYQICSLDWQGGGIESRLRINLSALLGTSGSPEYKNEDRDLFSPTTEYHKRIACTDKFLRYCVFDITASLDRGVDCAGDRMLYYSWETGTWSAGNYGKSAARCVIGSTQSFKENAIVDKGWQEVKMMNMADRAIFDAGKCPEKGDITIPLPADKGSIQIRVDWKSMFTVGQFLQTFEGTPHTSSKDRPFASYNWKWSAQTANGWSYETWAWQEKRTFGETSWEKIVTPYSVSDAFGKLRWFLLKNIAVTVVDERFHEEIQAEDVEYEGTINADAQEELSLDTICGSLDPVRGTALGLYSIAETGREHNFVLSRDDANVWANATNIENLLIGQLCKQYCSRKTVLSGEASISAVTGYRPQLFTEPHFTDKKFWLKAATTDVREAVSDCTFVELGEEEYKEEGA